jgi:hypothetical protein
MRKKRARGIIIITEFEHGQSYLTGFDDRRFNTCPGCSGVTFAEYDQDMLNRSCTHCKYEYRKHLVKNLERLAWVSQRAIEIEKQANITSRLHKHNKFININTEQSISRLVSSGAISAN